MRKVLLSFLLVAMLFQGIAQDFQKLYSEGKAYFDSEQYALALGKFAPITSISESSDIVKYASFFYAVSAYQSGDKSLAKNMFLQIQSKFGSWNAQELNYWLAVISAEEGDAEATFNYLKLVEDGSLEAQKNALKRQSIQSITDVNQLEYLLSANPGESVIASKLVSEILKQDVAEQDLDLLNQLQNSFDIQLDLSIEGIENSPKKSVYNIGLFLPFNYRSDSLSLVRLENNWAVRMERGARLAVQKLAEEGIDINLLTVDTRDPQARLSDIVATGNLDELDFMVGPVTQSSVQVMSEFSKERKINMINPLSSNSDILEDNPYAFLYYPSNETIARRAADYTKKHFTTNKNAAVFYTNFSDKPRADLYKTLIEKDSFNVTIFEGILPEESVRIQQMFVEEEEVDKDSLVVQAMLDEMDSLREAEVEDWEIYDERDFVYDTLKILPDSIGHIFIASDISSHATSALSGIEARDDTIEYISSSKFLFAESSISYEQLERLNAVFVGANLIDYSKTEVAEFRERYVNAYLNSPVKEERLGDAYIGYDIVMTYGRLLHRYGKYFQVGLKRSKNFSGEITNSFNYQLSNDNRYTPYYRVRNAQIEKIEEQN